MHWKTHKAFRNTPGWCPQEKAEYLCGLIETHHPSKILEIGVYAGKSLFPMALTTQPYDGKVFGIEPFAVAPTQEGINPASNDEYWGTIDYKQLEQSVIENTHKYGLGEVVTILKMTSKEALPVLTGQFDLIHQDSNHSEAVSSWETKNYTPLLAKGGFYVLDDIDWAVDGKLTNAKSIALLDKRFQRVHWVGEGKDQWAVWQNA